MGDGEAANPSIPEEGRHAEPPAVEESSASAVGENPAAGEAAGSEPSELPEAVVEKAPALPKPTVAGAERRWTTVLRRRHLPKPIRHYAVRKLDDLSRETSEAHWRDRDGADNEETRLPAGESVLTPQVWVTELYTPTTLSGLLDGLPKLEAKRPRGVRQEEAAADWVRSTRRLAGRSWRDLGYVFPVGSKRYWPESITDALPDGVDYVHLHLSALTATVTAITAAFRFDDSRAAALNRILQTDVTTRLEPIKGAGYSIVDVRWQKRVAADEHRAALRSDACRWLAERLPGSFVRLAPGQLPTIELLLTEQLEPWDPAGGGGPAEWVQLVDLEGGLGYWQSADLTGLRLAERRFRRSREADRHIAVLAARKGDLLAASAHATGPPTDLWQALGHLERSLPPLATRWTLVAFTREIEGHLNSVSDATERATRRRSPSALVDLRDQLIRTALEGRVLVNDIADFAEDVRAWGFNVPDFRKVPPPALSDTYTPETSLVDGLRTQVSEARRLTEVETDLRELIVSSAGLTAGAENLRLQRRIIWLTIVSLIVAAIAAVTAVVAVRDSHAPSQQAPAPTTTVLS